MNLRQHLGARTSDLSRFLQFLKRGIRGDSPPDIEIEFLRSQLGSYVYSSPACMFVALYLYNYAVDLPDDPVVLLWVLTYVLFQAVRTPLSLIFMRMKTWSPRQLNFWAMLAFSSLVIDGWIVMFLALGVYPLLHFTDALIVLMVSLIIVGATAFSQGGRWLSFAVYAPPVYLSFSWATWGLDHIYARPVAVLVMVFLVLYVFQARTQYNSSMESLILAKRNRELADELQIKNGQLQEVAQARSRLLATVSHDLRQPAHAIGLLSERALLEQTPSLVQEALRDLNELSQSLSASLTTLMDLTRLDAGLVKVQPTDMPLKKVLMRLDAEFSASARNKGLQMRVPHTDHWIRSDAVLLHGVLANLVSNAIKYTSEGSLHLDIEHQGDALTVWVQDTGMGIHPDKFDLIFKEFVRLDASEAGTEGLGLGLSIVKRYAALLEHPLQVQSEPGRGSRFGVQLPRVAPVHQQGMAAVADSADAAHPLDGLKVLVVDNVDLLLTSMVKTLRGWGCEVHAARNLEQAVALGRRVEFDAVISDYHLGDREPDGLALIAALRQLPRSASKHMVAVLMTGDVSSMLDAQAQQAAVQVLHKPVRPALLQDCLRTLLRQPLSASSTA